jgi:SAM-dependent methyltransferase
VLGVDLVAAWLPKGLAEAAAAGLAGQVGLVQGDLPALPVGDGACDLVWCRDTLSCLPDCGLALRECARVLRPGGGMVLYAVFATDRLERDPGDLTQDLLEVARLTRDRERMEAAPGPVWYRRALAFALWSPQILLGRLVPVLYALSSPDRTASGAVRSGESGRTGPAPAGTPGAGGRCRRRIPPGLPPPRRCRA